MPSRRATLTGIALLVTVGLFAADPAAGSASTYRTFPTCSVFAEQPKADSSCVFGNPFGAVLYSKHRGTIHYRLCFRPPHTKQHCRRLKAHHRKFSRARLFGRLADHAGTGTWRLTWKHGGHLIDRDRLHVGSEGV